MEEQLPCVKDNCFLESTGDKICNPCLSQVERLYNGLEYNGDIKEFAYGVFEFNRGYGNSPLANDVMFVHTKLLPKIVKYYV